MKKDRVLLAVACVLFAFPLGVGAAPPVGPKTPTPAITPVVTGLNNPRGVALDAEGNLYVAEAGPYLGQDPSHAYGDEHGLTMGNVSKWARPGTPAQQKLWSTQFTSLWDNFNDIPEVLGVAGLSAFGNERMDDFRGGRSGGVYVILGESASGFAHENPSEPVPPQIGHLFRLGSGNGVAVDAADVGDQNYQWTGAHSDLFPPDFPDSNPYAVLATRMRDDRVHFDGMFGEAGGKLRVFVADAGANTVSEVAGDGSTHVIAYIPNDGVRDATPTCVTKGPDGALYVGTLDLVKNAFGHNPGQSDVWRIEPNTNEGYLNAAHLWASGLTTVTSCAFDRAGNFWATEMFQPNANGAPGDLVRIPFDDPSQLDRVGGGQLPFPGGIAIGPGGRAYVSINSLTFQPDSGAVVRMRLN